MEPITRGHTLMVHRKPPRARARRCRANFSRSACHLPPWIPDDGRHPAQPPHASLRKNIESHTHILGSFPCLVKTQRFQVAVSRRTPILSAVRPHPPAQPAGCGPRRTSGRLHACNNRPWARGRVSSMPSDRDCAPHPSRGAFRPRRRTAPRWADVGVARLPSPPSPGAWAGGLPSSTAASHRGVGGGPDTWMARPSRVRHPATQRSPPSARGSRTG